MSKSFHDMTNDLNRQTGKAVENATRTLPPGWRIVLEIERNAGWVELNDPDGETVDFPTNHETLGGEIDDAVRHAIGEAAP